MKGIEKFTQEELNKVFDAAVTIKEIMQKYEDWKELIGCSEIYRECFNIQIAVMNEERKRLLEHG